MPTAYRIIPCQYRDSVALMQLSATLAKLPGVKQASAVMGTENNISLLRQTGMYIGNISVGPSDLLIIVEGDEAALVPALDRAQARLSMREPEAGSNGGVQRINPRSIAMALAENPDAKLAIVSTPGEYATAEALKALHLGINVMLFSNNVSAPDEAMLKRVARSKDLIVMGPDCGTAIINGIPLGFANVVKRGPIGAIGASGTGLQEVTVLVDRLGAGISQALGTGGHDMSVEVGGISMLTGLKYLTEDVATKVIVLISKPPAKEIADEVLGKARTSGKPVVANFLGADAKLLTGGNIYGAQTLEDAARAAVALAAGRAPVPANEAIDSMPAIPKLAASQKYIRGLFSGGTFCFEAAMLLQKTLEIHSNSPVCKSLSLKDIWKSEGHTVVDLGDDVFTRGRPHPMIDYRLRAERIVNEAKDPEMAVLLLDVVLGFGANANPAAELAPALNEARKIAEANGRAFICVAHICGTDKDPQDFATQAVALRAAGVILAGSNAQAVRMAQAIVGRKADEETRMSKLFNEGVIINVGLSSFGEAVIKTGGKAQQVDWSPQASGDRNLGLALARILKNDAIETANETAYQRYLQAQPILLGIGIAGKDLPGVEGRMLLHAGPPIDWGEMCGPMQGAIIGAILYEGWAASPEEARTLAGSGGIKFDPCHHHAAVGPMAGVISPSMPVWIVENADRGNRAFSNMNEGLGKVLRFGANSKEVIDRLKWIATTLGPVLEKGLKKLGPIEMKPLIGQALHMGDECHNRNAAASSLLFKRFAPAALDAGVPHAQLADSLRFLAGNDHFFLNLSMATCKAMLDAAHGVQNSSMVTAMARNGVRFGIRVSGTGDAWFQADAPVVDGLYFPSYGPGDAAKDLGDSAITETAGIGGFATAAAPAIVQFVGGTASDALANTLAMTSITLGCNNAFTLPPLNFRGTPAGIDARMVLDTNILPVINTGIAHKNAGVGQVGAGITRAPLDCFAQAVAALAAAVG